MEKLLTAILKFLPLIFAFGFLVPVIAGGADTLGWVPPFGLTTLSFALIIGGAWGLFLRQKGAIWERCRNMPKSFPVTDERIMEAQFYCLL